MRSVVTMNWERREITPLEHRWAGVDSFNATDQTLVSPPLAVGGGTLTLSFEQRYSFEFVGGSTPAWFDGMVLELSEDGDRRVTRVFSALRRDRAAFARAFEELDLRFRASTRH